MNQSVLFKVKNFKNLKNAELELKPLTFLFGANGSGKSSLLKAIKFLQSNLLPTLKFPTEYKITGEIDLGSFKEIVNGNDISKSVALELKIINNNGTKDHIPYLTQVRTFKPRNANTSNYGFIIEDNDDNFEISYLEYQSRSKSESVAALLDNMEDVKEPEKCLDINYEGSLSIKIDFGDNEDGNNINMVEMKDIDTGAIARFYFNHQKTNPNLKIDKFCEGQPDSFDLNLERYFKVFPQKSANDLFRDFFDWIFIFPFKEYYWVDINETMIDKDYSVSDELGHIVNILKHQLKKYIYENLQGTEAWEKLTPLKKKHHFFAVLDFLYKCYERIPVIVNDVLKSSYISTTRKSPEHLYLLSNNSFKEEHYYGYLNQFIKVDIVKDEKYGENLINVINLGIKFLELGKGIEVKREGKVGWIVFKGAGGEESNLAEASSGLLQVLPIVVESLLCRWGNHDNINQHSWDLLLIEQPELHLHPNLQAKLAEFFAVDGANKFIIETHSEHIIRKIQVLVARGELNRDKLAIYFFDKKNKSTRINEMEMDEKGFFTSPWPDGFFDTSYNLARELLTSRKN